MSKHNDVKFDENQISIFDILYPERKQLKEEKGERQNNQDNRVSKNAAKQFYITNLMRIFNKSFINHINELILIPKTNLYFSLHAVESYVDLKCKVLEWCSRDAVKSMPYPTNRGNTRYQNDVRENINIFLRTNFTREDMELIYQELGNCINHELTMKFVQSNYDLNVLRREEE